jgi:hypothetical protein
MATTAIKIRSKFSSAQYAVYFKVIFSNSIFLRPDWNPRISFSCKKFQGLQVAQMHKLIHAYVKLVGTTHGTWMYEKPH